MAQPLRALIVLQRTSVQLSELIRQLTPSVTPVPEDLIPSLRHTCKLNTNKHFKKEKKHNNQNLKLMDGMKQIMKKAVCRREKKVGNL